MLNLHTHSLQSAQELLLFIRQISSMAGFRRLFMQARVLARSRSVTVPYLGPTLKAFHDHVWPIKCGLKISF